MFSATESTGVRLKSWKMKPRLLPRKIAAARPAAYLFHAKDSHSGRKISSVPIASSATPPIAFDQRA